MRTILCIILITGLFTIPAEAGSIFDELKQRGMKVLENVEETVDTGKPEAQDQKTQRQSSKTKARNTRTSSKTSRSEVEAFKPIKSASDIYGQWGGMVKPPGRGYSMETMGINAVISPDFGSLSVSLSVSRCLGELKAAGEIGKYEATFTDESNSCGTRATVSFADEGRIRVEWIDMPGLSSNKRDLQRSVKAQAHTKRTKLEFFGRSAQGIRCSRFQARNEF